MLRHYAGLSEEHGATTSILKQADRPLVYTLRSDVGNHAIGAAPLQGERPNERKNRNMKIQLRGKPPPRRKSPQARMKSLPEDPFIPSYKTLRRPSKTRGTVREMLVGVTFQTTYEFFELLGGQGHGLLTSGDWWNGEGFFRFFHWLANRPSRWSATCNCSAAYRYRRGSTAAAPSGFRPYVGELVVTSW
jgi:hypothetical protein